VSGPFDRPIAELLAGLQWLADPGLVAHNQTYRPLSPTATVVSAFEGAAREHGRRIAVVFGDEKLTYAQLLNDVGGLADRLCRRGIGAGDVVAVKMDPSPRRLIAVLGILSAGAAYLPLDPDLPNSRMHAQVVDASASSIVAEADGELDLCDLHPSRPPSAERGPVLPSSSAYVMYTSGSTGKPKGVLVSHLSLINRLEWMLRELRVGPADRVLHKTAFGFDVSIWEQLLPLTVGGRVIIAGADDRRDAFALARLVRDCGITVIHFVPTMLAAFVDSGVLDELPSLRAIVASGEALTQSLAARVSAACGASLYNFYGPTEATIDATAHRVSPGHDGDFVPLGHPIDNTAVHVLDARLRPVAVGEQGELCVGGAAVAVGYLGRGSLTAKQFVPDPFGTPGTRMYRTGDLVRLHPDGVLEFLGRADRQVKLRGFRIELAEVEHALLADPRISNAAVVLHSHPVRGDSLVAHLVAIGGADREILEAQVRASLSERLPQHMIPSAFVLHDSLPVTKSGKVDHAALPPPEIARKGTGPLPIGKTEHQLRDVWQRVVGVADIGRDDNFFQTGGDSIAAIRVVSLARRLGLHFEVRDIFESPTIASLARVLETRGQVTLPVVREAPSPPEPLANWAMRGNAEPIIMALRVADAQAKPHLPRLVRGILEDLWPDKTLRRAVNTIILGAAPSVVDVIGQANQWWRGRADRDALIGAALLVARDSDLTWVVLAGDAASVDRATLSLVAAEIEIRYCGGNSVFGPTVPAGDLLDAAAQLPHTRLEWAGESTPAAYRSHPALTTHCAWPAPRVARDAAHHIGQAALLTALGQCGFTSVEITLSPDREWIASTGWDVRTLLGQWSSRRRTRLLLSSRGWDSVRAVKRLGRGLDPDKATDTPELTVDVAWFDIVHRHGFWREDRDTASVATSDVSLGVVFALDGADLTIRWHGSDTVDQPLLVRLAEQYATALHALADAHEESWLGADPSDHPLVELDVGQAREISRLGLVDCYRLAPMQEGLLVRALFWPESDAYHNQNVLELLGPLDADRLEQCWHQVAARYEMLRTGFAWDNLKHPIQFVASGQVRSFDRRSWARSSPDEVDKQLTNLLREDRGRPFNLRLPGVYRIYLVQVSNDRHLLLWSHHHILLDGWCLSLIWGDVFALYGAGLSGRPAVKPAPRRFRDFVRWLQDKRVSTADTTYWHNQLASIATACHLSDYGPEREGPFETRRVRFSRERTHRASILAHDCRVTLNAVVQAGWSLLLATYTSQRDVVHGVSISGRPPELDGVEMMVGLFINTVPLHVRINADEAVAGLLNRVQLQLAEAGAHGHVPLAEILAHWPNRSDGARPFDSLIAFESYPEDNLPDGPVDGVEIVDQLASEKTEFPLGLIVLPGPELELHWNYDTTHFQAEQVEQMIGTFEVLIDGMSAQPAGRVGNLPLMSVREQRLVDRWCHGRFERPIVESPFDGFTRTARLTPDAIALVADRKSATYAELERDATAVARQLVVAGCKPGDSVIIALRRSGAWVHAVLGTHAMGATPVLIDVDQPLPVLARTFDNVAPAAALVDPNVPADIQSLVARTIDVNNRGATGPPLTARGDRIAYVALTSGSTGSPKAIGAPQVGLVNRIEWSLRAYRINGRPTLLLNASPSFDIVLWELYYPLFAGGTVVVAPHGATLDTEAFIETVCREQISVLHLTPTVLAEFVSSDRASSCTSLQIVVTGGEMVSPELVRAFFDLGLACRLHQAYGPAEAAISVTDHRCAPNDSKLARVPIGRPIDNCECYVLDDALRPLPPGIEGDLYLAGDCLAMGYLDLARQTALAFVPSPWTAKPGSRMYRTGDRAVWLSNGELEFRGRRDHQVKIRGYRVDLEGVEAVLRRHPACAAAVVLTRTTAEGTTALEALVECGEAGAISPDALRGWLSTQVPAPMVPSSVRVLPALPRTSSGKLDRPGAARLRPAPPAVPAPTRSPTKMEQLIARTWAHELNLDHVGLDQDVFRLGATSLSVMRVFAKLKKLLPASSTLEVAHLFKGSTPAQLAELVLAPVAGSGAGCVLTLTPGRSETPLFLVHPVQGVSTAYLALRDQVADLEIYAFNNPRLSSGMPFTAVEEMAAVYVEWVRSIARSRLPLIGGWSFGGVVALEMARQIRAKDGAVGAVLLIDTHRCAHEPVSGVLSAGAQGELDLLSAEAARNRAMTIARNEVPYDGRVVLLRAQDIEGTATDSSEDRCGWEARLLPALTVIEVAGTHLELFSERHITTTADAIRKVVLATPSRSDPSE
jgi:amino acid adenylation domain-containing protein